MKFLCLYKPGKPEGTPPTQDHMVKMGQLIEEFTNSGVLISTEGCLPSAKGARVRLANGNFTGQIIHLTQITISGKVCSCRNESIPSQ